MDQFTPLQCEQARAFWRQLPRNRRAIQELYSETVEKMRTTWTSFEPWTHFGVNSDPRNLGPMETLKALISLNGVAPISLCHALLRAKLDAETKWPSTFRAQWLPYSMQEGAHTAYMKSAAEKAWIQWTRNHALTERSTQPSRWHTWITSSFVHAEGMHLVANMFAFWNLGKLVIALPGMTSFHLACLALGGSFFGSAATILSIQGFHSYSPFICPRWSAAGASAIVCAFGAVAGLGSPRESVKLMAGPIDVNITAWGFAALSVASEIIGWSRSRKGYPAIGVRGIGHSAHLAGFAFGAAYYFLFLRPTSEAGSQEHQNLASSPITLFDSEAAQRLEQDESDSMGTGAVTPSGSEASEYEPSPWQDM